MNTGLWCFYTVQGDRGDSEQHPNAFQVAPAASDGPVLLEEFVRAFPLAGSAAFHYRFQVASPVGKVYVDAMGPRDRVPVINGIIIAKVLRMGEWPRGGLAGRARPRCCSPRTPVCVRQQPSRYAGARACVCGDQHALQTH